MSQRDAPEATEAMTPPPGGSSKRIEKMTIVSRLGLTQHAKNNTQRTTLKLEDVRVWAVTAADVCVGCVLPRVCTCRLGVHMRVRW